MGLVLLGLLGYLVLAASQRPPRFYPHCSRARHGGPCTMGVRWGGGAAIFATASARNARRACPSAAVALSRSGDWLVHKTTSLKAFPGFLFFSYPAALFF